MYMWCSKKANTILMKEKNNICKDMHGRRICIHGCACASIYDHQNMSRIRTNIKSADMQTCAIANAVIMISMFINYYDIIASVDQSFRLY